RAHHRSGRCGTRPAARLLHAGSEAAGCRRRRQSVRGLRSGSATAESVGSCMTTVVLFGSNHAGLPMKPSESPSETTVDRRDLVKVSAAAAGVLAAGLAAPLAVAQETKIEAQEHWAMKGAVKLYLYRKRLMTTGQSPKPVLFLVHGS